VKAIDYIRKGWTQGQSAIDIHGHRVYCCSRKAIAWCSTGAIEAAYRDGGSEEACRKLRSVVKSKILTWNDKKWRTKKQVLAAFKKAGI
jgi:hypothetical protein